VGQGRRLRLGQSRGLEFSNGFVLFDLSRSNDAYKAAFMNIFALVQLRHRIAHRIGELSGQPVQVGRYCHMADSYHIHGSYFREFENRFLGMLQKRSFEQRTLRYEDVCEMMEEARPMILQNAQEMGKG
jgi:thymidylate synthase